MLQRFTGTSTAAWITRTSPNMCFNPFGLASFISSPFGCRMSLLLFSTHYIFCSFFLFIFLRTRRTHIATWTEIAFLKNVISVKIMKSYFQNAISRGVIIVYMLTTVYTLSHGLKSCFFKTSSLLHTLIEYTLPCGLKSCF